MSFYVLSEGKFDKIFLNTIMEIIGVTFCSIYDDTTKTLQKTSRDYYQNYQFILFADNGRLNLYSKVLPRFVKTFFDKTFIQPIQVIFVVDNDDADESELNTVLHNHLSSLNSLIPGLTTEVHTNENVVKIRLINESYARIIIKAFYIPHSLEHQIVWAGLKTHHNNKLIKEVFEKDPHTGLDLFSLALSCSVEETIKKSILNNWLIDHSWYQDLLKLLKNPRFS